MTTPSAVLYGQTACNNLDRLRRHLRSPWQLLALPEDGNGLAHFSNTIQDAQVLVSAYWKTEMAEMAPRLKLIQTLGAGVDAYNLAAVPLGCALCRVCEHAVPVAEYVVGALVAMTARIIFHDAQLRQGRWTGTGRRDGEPHEELHGKTLGLLGFGSIGSEVAVRAAALGLRVRAIRAHPLLSAGGAPLEWVGGPAQLRELLAASDYLVICCPLNAQTNGLLNAAMLACMKPAAYLINVARAEIVEERALFDALASRRIAGAALDVWYRYPESASECLLPAASPFHQLDNVLMTPHLSAWTHAMIERRWERIAGNFDAIADGRQLDNVVVEAGRKT